MIASVTGKLEGVTTESVILNVNGFGVEIITTFSIISSMPSVGNEIKLYTYLQVKEDLMQLYGFLNKEDLDFFKLLITVNGIGPKAAIAILSSMSVDVLTFAILSEDIKTISKAQGVGTKTAKKLVLDLKDKVGVINPTAVDNINITDTTITGIRGEATEVLTALGYSGTDALKAINSVKITDDMTSEELVKLALKNLV